MVLDDDIPDGVGRFLDEHVENLEQLELLLFVTARGGGPLTLDEIARGVALPAARAATQLDHLAGRGLVASAPDGTWGHVSTPAVREQLAAVAAAYEGRRAAVLQHVATRALENLRAFTKGFRRK